MEKVLEQARLLAEAIAESDVYQHMRQCENDAMKDPEATKLIADFVEKRQGGAGENRGLYSRARRLRAALYLRGRVSR